MGNVIRTTVAFLQNLGSLDYCFNCNCPLCQEEKEKGGVYTPIIVRHRHVPQTEVPISLRVSRTGMADDRFLHPIMARMDAAAVWPQFATTKVVERNIVTVHYVVDEWIRNPTKFLEKVARYLSKAYNQVIEEVRSRVEGREVAAWQQLEPFFALHKTGQLLGTKHFREKDLEAVVWLLIAARKLGYPKEKPEPGNKGIVVMLVDGDIYKEWFEVEKIEPLPEHPSHDIWYKTGPKGGGIVSEEEFLNGVEHTPGCKSIFLVPTK